MVRDNSCFSLNFVSCSMLHAKLNFYSHSPELPEKGWIDSDQCQPASLALMNSSIDDVSWTELGKTCMESPEEK